MSNATNAATPGFDPTIKDRHAASALDAVARHDAETATNARGRLSRKCDLNRAISDAMASGVAHFQASVACGSLSRAMPHDGGTCVLVALKNAGLKIVRDRSNRTDS